MSGDRLRIGVSSCIMHADPTRPLFKGKTLLYAEESMLAWIMSGGALPVLLPRAMPPITAHELLGTVDGLVLQGGVDMSPGNYGEEPVRPEWAGDPIRDRYEMELVALALETDKPLLGICRGAQVLNVALGGSLYQDIITQHEQGHLHRNWELYDRHGHEITVEPGTGLASWYGFSASGGRSRINSVHHQAVNRVGRDLVVEARSMPDGIVEAIRFAGQVNGRTPFAFGVQWHPEFMYAEPTEGQLDPNRLLAAFLDEVRARKGARRVMQEVQQEPQEDGRGHR